MRADTESMRGNVSQRPPWRRATAGSARSPRLRLFGYGEDLKAGSYNYMQSVVVGFARNEWFRVLLLCLILFFCQTKLSKSTELFDLNELSASQESRLWTQVDNWAVAVVLASFCERPTSLEERMLKIANHCVTTSSIKKLLERFHAAMTKAEGNIWNCKDTNVQMFVDKTVAKANLLVSQAEEACRVGSIYRRLLPLIE